MIYDMMCEVSKTDDADSFVSAWVRDGCPSKPSRWALRRLCERPCEKALRRRCEGVAKDFPINMKI